MQRDDEELYATDLEDPMLELQVYAKNAADANEGDERSLHQAKAVGSHADGWSEQAALKSQAMVVHQAILGGVRSKDKGRTRTEGANG